MWPPNPYIIQKFIAHSTPLWDSSFGNPSFSETLIFPPLIDLRRMERAKGGAKRCPLSGAMRTRWPRSHRALRPSTAWSNTWWRH